ncbi:hypothetical protein C8F01DRAFT_1063586 [Mycena amicta]|nr:hypothetical protein C8F01DRAFT_1063586 [Mycena amicta]
MWPLSKHLKKEAPKIDLGSALATQKTGRRRRPFFLPTTSTLRPRPPWSRSPHELGTTQLLVSEAQFIDLVNGNLIPLYVVLVGFTWIIHDYFVTLEDEIRYIWPQPWNFSKLMFFWIRYYSIALLTFDAIQIHVFSVPGFTSDRLCIAMDTIIRVVGAILLWSVEIVMQLRVYALYNCSKPIALINLVLFLGSIAGFLGVLIYNHSKRAEVIAEVIHLPLPGCPTVHSGIEWALWVPATAFEGILFLFALTKAVMATAEELRTGPPATRRGMSLYALLLRDNVVYFLAVAGLLLFNNLMVVNVTRIPWFSYGPFHAAVGILTTRMLLNLRKATAFDINRITLGGSGSGSVDFISQTQTYPSTVTAHSSRASHAHAHAFDGQGQRSQHKWLDVNFDFEKQTTSSSRIDVELRDVGSHSRNRERCGCGLATGSPGRQPGWHWRTT